MRAWYSMRSTSAKVMEIRSFFLSAADHQQEPRVAPTARGFNFGQEGNLAMRRIYSREEIIKGLGGNLDTGMCRCPAHDDNTPSLHVGNGRKGVVWKCHAGCSQEEVREALREKGLWHDGG